MVFGFTDPGGDRPTPNRSKEEYKSVRSGIPSFQDPGLSAGQYGFGSGRNKNKSSDDGNSNKEIADKFKITQPGKAYRDTGNTVQEFQKDLAKAAQFGLFTQHPFTKKLMDKYNLDTQDIIDLRLGTGSGGVGRADPSKLYNKNFISNLGDARGNRAGVFQKLYGSGMFPMATYDPTLFGQRGIGAFREGMSVFDRPAPQGLKDQLGAFLSSRFDKIAGGSPYGIAALDFGRNVLGYEGDQLNQFASSVAGNRDLYNQMMTQPYMIDKKLKETMYGYQQSNKPKGNNQETKPQADPITAAYDPAGNPYGNFGIGNFL